MFSFIFRRLFKEVVDGEKRIIHGLLPHVPDARDFLYADLGGLFGGYAPKHDRMELPILEIKDQNPNNTCVFHSYASCRENDEDVALSPRSLVVYAKQKGYLRADGLSSIRNGQKAGMEFGIAAESLLPNDNLPWSRYSNVILSPGLIANAATHRPKSYFWVHTKEEWLKALDDGHPIHTGFDWYSSYNQSGGLSAPWILPWKRGWRVGGHAVKVAGYDIPKGLLTFQNSFGPNWGDNGKFYVRFNDFFRWGCVGAVALDLEGDDLASFIEAHEGKDLKCSQDPGIYRIQDGKKRPYPNEQVFEENGGVFDRDGVPSYEICSSTLLSLIPMGEPMTA